MNKIKIDDIICVKDRNVHASKIAKLACNIKEVGLIQPIVLVQTSDDKYKVIAGRCRYKALKLNKVTELIEHEHYRIISVPEKNEALISYAENDERNDLTLFEQIKQLKELSKLYTRKELSKLLGRSEKWLALRCNLSKLTSQWLEEINKNVGDKEHSNLTLKHYEIIATYPVDPQDEIFEWGYIESDIKEFKEDLKNRFERNIKDFVFETSDCGQCSKRSSQNSLFFDYDSENDKCLDPDCYKEKFKDYINKTAKEINENPNLGDPLYLVSSEYYYDEEIKDVITYHHFHELKDDSKPNAFDIATGKTICIKIDDNFLATQNIKKADKEEKLELNPTQKLEELQKTLEQKRHKRCLEKLIDFLDNGEYTMPDTQTCYRLIALLGISGSYNNFCYWGEQESYQHYSLEDWHSIKNDNLHNVVYIVWQAITSELKSKLKQTISLTLDRIKNTEALIICDILGLDYNDFFTTAIAEIPEPKSWEKYK